MLFTSRAPIEVQDLRANFKKLTYALKMVFLRNPLAKKQDSTISQIRNEIKASNKNSQKVWSLILIRKSITKPESAGPQPMVSQTGSISSASQINPQKGNGPQTKGEEMPLFDFERKGVDLVYEIFEDKFTKPSQADPLFILHGLFGCKETWRSTVRNLLKQLNPPRKVIILDQRNHGESPHTPEHTYELMGCDLLKLMKCLDVPKAHVLGHSMGGRTGMYVALHQPDRVTSLIVVDTSPVTIPVELIEMLPKIFKILHRCEIETVRGSLAVVRKQADDIMKHDIEDKAFRDFLLRNIRPTNDGTGSYQWRINITALTQYLQEMKYFKDHVQNKQYIKPTFFIGGELSHFLPKRDKEPIKNLFPEAKFDFINATGHLVHNDSPVTFVKRVASFLNYQKS